MSVVEMNREDVKTDWEKPNSNPLEGLTREDINKILEYRSELLMEISRHYAAFTEAIFKLPIHVIFRQHAFFNLDQAEMWTKKGIDNVWDVPKSEKKSEEQEQSHDSNVAQIAEEPRSPDVIIDSE